MSPNRGRVNFRYISSVFVSLAGTLRVESAPVAKRSSTIRSGVPRRRTNAVRVTDDIARRIREGHPWVFRDALRGRQLASGSAVDVLDGSGEFLARAEFDSSGPIGLRIFSRERSAKLDPAAVLDVVDGCVARRAVHDIPETCHRLVNGDSEGLPAVNVDRFGDYLLCYYYSEVAENQHDALLEALASRIDSRGVYLQRRYRTHAGPRPGAELVAGAAATEDIVVDEEGARYGVDVTAPLSVGFFTDMRLGRRALQRYVQGARVLNCFSYTGAFSVVAALHGADQVVSVDSASRVHARARQNFSLNDLDPNDRRYEFITGDAFAQLTQLNDLRRQFDVVVLDPPTFSSGGGSGKGRAFTALKDYSELVTLAAQVLAPNGVLVAACNAAKLPAMDVERAIGGGLAGANRGGVIVERIGLAPDFPVLPSFSEGSYLKVFFVRVT